MSGYSFPPLNVGFQRDKEVGALRLFFYSFVAFLTAETLPLGLERNDARYQGCLKNIFRPLNGGNSLSIAWGDKDRGIASKGGTTLIQADDLVIRATYAEPRRAGGSGRVLFRLSVQEAAKQIMLRDCNARSDADEGHYTFSGEVRRRDGKPLASYPLYNSFFAASTFCWLLSACRKGERVLIRADGLDVVVPGKVVLTIGLLVFSIITVWDVIVGAVLRVLQAPYFSMVYFWHHVGGPCFYAKVDENGTKRCAVFRLRDQVFTCFAVVMNSVVVAALVEMALLRFLGASKPVLMAAGVFSGPLAVLTLAGVFLTAANMRAANMRLAVESDRMLSVIKDYSLATGNPSTVLTAAPQPTKGEETSAEVVGVSEDEKCRRGVWRGACGAAAEIMYLGEVLPGAYLRPEWSAGYCGTTAFSFVEEVWCFVSSLLPTASVMGLEITGMTPEQLRAARA